MSTVYLTREVANEFIDSYSRSDNPNLKKIAEIYQGAIRAGEEVNSSEGIIIFPKGKEKDLKNFNVLLGAPWDLAQFFNNRATLESKERTKEARKEMKIFVNSVKGQVCFSAEGRLSGIWNRLVVTVLSLGSWLGCSCATMAIAKRIETLAIKLIDKLHKDIAIPSPTSSPRPSEPDVLPVAQSQATEGDDGRGLGEAEAAALQAMDARAVRNAARREQVRREGYLSGLAHPNRFAELADEEGMDHQATMHPEAKAAAVAALVEGLSDSEGENS